MVVQIRLSERVEHTLEQIASDSLNRAWRGYDPAASDKELWEHNRGRWNLNEQRIDDERYATFVYGNKVVAAYAIRGHERVVDANPNVMKIALIGNPLVATDPAYHHLVGQPATHTGRNAINYVEDPSMEDNAARAFLLTWNPDKWDWVDFSQRVVESGEGRPVDEPWSTGNRKGGIYSGDRVFLLRQGQQGRGIIGSGQAIDYSGHAGINDEIIHTDEHWDGSVATTNYVEVLWDRLVAPDHLLPVDVLHAEFPGQNWTPMASGTKIRPDLVPQLEARWSDHIGRNTDTARGQGRLSDSARRKAIEDAAQDRLMRHYHDDGWDVKDTRYSGPYDAIATKGKSTLYLEAKGTQGNGDAVFLTHGEVAHARRHPGDCVIGIWSGMRFTDGGKVDPEAGEHLIMPFEPDTGTLSPLQYRWDFNSEV